MPLFYHYKNLSSEKNGGLNGTVGEISEKTSQTTTQKTVGETVGNTTQSTAQRTTQTLTDKQVEILNYLKLNSKASRKEIAQNIAGITADGVKYNLKRLQDTGLLKRIGPDFGGHWEIVKNEK